MRKYLLVVFILLNWTGVGYLYAQDLPTASVSFEKERFCEDEKVAGAIMAKMTILLTGAAPYDFDYYINYRSDADFDYDQKFEVRAYNANSFVVDIPLSKSETISVKHLHDSNYPIGGESGSIIGGEVEIIVDLVPTPVISDPIKTCDLDLYLSAAKEFESSTSLWRLENSSDGILSDASVLNPIFEASSDGVYNLFFKEIQGTCQNEVSKSIAAVNKPSPNGSIKSFTNDICAGQQSIIELNLTGTFPITVYYTDGDVELEESSLHQIETLPLVDNVVYDIFRFVDVDGCVSDENEQAEITVDFVPDVDAGTDIIACNNEVTLDAVLNSNCFGEWIYEPAPHYFSDASSASSLFTVPEHLQIASENFILTWRVTNKNNIECFDNNTVVVQLNKQPQSTIITNVDKVYNAQEIELEATPIIEGMDGKWEAVDFPSSEPFIEMPNSNITYVKELERGNYSFRWIVYNGDVCMPSESMVTFVNKGIYETNGFSPNADGVNDFFIIGGAKNVTNNKLTVFDVTGEVVFQTNDFCYPNTPTEFGWNGQKNDGKIEDGTYYYIFEGDDIDPIKSYLIIKGSRQ